MQRMWLGIGCMVGALLLMSGGCASEPLTSTGPGGAGDGDGDGDLGDGDGNPGDGDGNPGDGDGNPGDGDGDGDSGDGDDACGSIEKEAEVTRGPVDIVLALDTSGSMSDEICAVSKNLSSFADGIGPETRVTAAYQVGVDLIFQLLFLCGKEDPLASTTLAADPNRYLKVDRKVDSHNAFSVLLNQFDSYKAFLRPGAPTHFVVVTDDESNTDAASFKSQMEAKLGGSFYFHAIVATGGSCSGSGVGNQYMSLADTTGGQKLSICASEAEWTALFKKLEDAVVASAPLPCEFDIPEPPPGEILDPTKVSVGFTPLGGAKSALPKASTEGACGSDAGWYFDDNDTPTRIEFCPAACTEVKRGGKLGIAFGCEPPVVL